MIAKEDSFTRGSRSLEKLRWVRNLVFVVMSSGVLLGDKFGYQRYAITITCLIMTGVCRWFDFRLSSFVEGNGVNREVKLTASQLNEVRFEIFLMEHLAAIFPIALVAFWLYWLNAATWLQEIGQKFQGN